MKFLRLLVIQAAALLTACTSATTDIRRPLVIDDVSVGAENVAAITRIAPGTTGDDAQRSLKLTAKARDMFRIHRYNESYASLSIRQLAVALNYVPANPYAWIQLGEYLFLNQQPVAAIEATERGLTIIAGVCNGEGCPKTLRRLQQLGRINLAIYYCASERPLEATLVLDLVDSPSLSPFERLSYAWISAEAAVDIGNTTTAREQLDGARKISERTFTFDQTVDYPQYSGDRRAAMQYYLEGRACLVDAEQRSTQGSAQERAANAGTASEAYRCARELFSAALAADSELWDAKLALANVAQDEKKESEAIRILLELKEKAPRKMLFHAERTDFNLGNAYVTRYDNSAGIEDLLAARKAYGAAADMVARRSHWLAAQHRELNAVRDLRPEISAFLASALASTPGLYSDALNNVGSVYVLLAKLATNDAERAQLLAAAESTWRGALQDQAWPKRYLAYANLARLYGDSGRLAEAVDAAQAALRLEPLHIGAIRALLDIALRQDDIRMASRAAYVASVFLAGNQALYRGAFTSTLSSIEECLRAHASDELYQSDVQQ